MSISNRNKKKKEPMRLFPVEEVSAKGLRGCATAWFNRTILYPAAHSALPECDKTLTLQSRLWLIGGLTHPINPTFPLG